MRSKNIIFTGIVILLSVILLFPNLVSFAQEGNAIKVGFFESYALQPGSRIEVPLEVREADNLYGIDIEVRFNPDVITIEDANPNADGIQPALGTFLDAGLMLFNEVDNEQGIVRFVMSQVNPSEPKSGDGVLIVLYVRALQEGESDLSVTKLELANRFGEGLPGEPVESVVVVETDAEEKETTPIPVQDQEELIIIPTLAPTATPTEVPPTAAPTEVLPTTNPTMVAEVDEDQAPVGEDQEEGSIEDEKTQLENQEEPEEDRGFSILRYWWILLILVVIIIGMVIYLIKS